MSLWKFLGYGWTNALPGHSTISRTRWLIDEETHRTVFLKVLEIMGKEGCLPGRTLGIDATTLETNTALKSIVRRDTGENYREFLTRLAQASGIVTSTREELARFDRKREKKGVSAEWIHPQDPDAQIIQMKDGRTHLAYKA